MTGCTDCVSDYGGCCKFVLSGGWKIILLPSEVRKMVAAAGGAGPWFDNSPLAEYQRQYYVSHFASTDPLWVRLIELWPAPTGIKSYCPFIASRGCTLPYREKPFLCQAFPLDFNVTTNSIFLPRETCCSMAERAESAEEILSYFGDEMEDLKRRFGAFRQEFQDSLAVLERGGAPSLKP